MNSQLRVWWICEEYDSFPSKITPRSLKDSDGDIIDHLEYSGI